MDGLDAGADDYLTKPFTARELLARVSAHLAMRRRRMDAEEALKESQAALQSFYDSSPFYMGLIELHGDAVVPLYWNAAASDFFGREGASKAGGRNSEFRRRLKHIGSATTGRAKWRTVRFGSNMNTRWIRPHAG